MPKLSANEFTLLRHFIDDHCGIHLTDDKMYLIESRLARLLVEQGLSSFEALYQKLMGCHDNAMVERVIDAIATNETYWFRDPLHWQVIRDVCMPTWVQALSSGKKNKIRLWSAAVSSGQEAYGLAMVILDYLAEHKPLGIQASDFEILATDISGTVLSMARAGVYDQVAMARGMESTFKQRYFEQLGLTWRVCDSVKALVEFKKMNLQNRDYGLQQFELILLRHVLIYFSDALTQDIHSRMHQRLTPEGYFFLGGFEWYYCTDVHFLSIHALQDQCVYYQPK